MAQEAEKVLPWLARELGWEAPVFAGALSGGNSNMTWSFESGSEACVVRTFPAETISPTAHRGIEREEIVLRAVEGHVKAPRVLGWCDDSSVLGRPFLVVERIDGTAITDTLPSAYASDKTAPDKLGRDLIDQLAAIHNVPFPSPALEKIGRPENFLKRQLARWIKVREDTAVRDLPALFSLGQWLLNNIPPPCEPCLIHGDYHLDNTLASRELPEILAVIDWEMATVGDPYTDLGLVLMLWGAKRTIDPPAFNHLQAISRRPGVIDRRHLAERWALATGRGLDHLDYYMAFSFWRLAAIVEGAYCLFEQGKVDSQYAQDLKYNVPALLAEAQRAASGDW
ncbi:MAG: phosphotransferase family protein [Congregibacter sp.]|nr:phosphotransferase family protein [Congregibacter sp.]MDP5071067.1 phosphotransferase family protein [Congregibacter sp.]